MIYQQEPDLSPEECVDVLVRSTLAERRPVHDAGTIQVMLITDFAFCTYLSDLAVDEKYQRQGIGRELIRRTHEAAGLHTNLTLLPAPRAQSYYPHIGMTKHESCWVIARQPRNE